MIRINLASVPVDDQAKARRFYTEVLGFKIKEDTPMGGDVAWLTVVSDADPDGVQLLLEPMTGHAPAAAYQKSLKDAGIPWTAFLTDDIDAEHARLTSLGVSFDGPPKDMGPVRVCRFDDTCGNLIQLYQV